MTINRHNGLEALTSLQPAPAPGSKRASTDEITPELASRTRRFVRVVALVAVLVSAASLTDSATAPASATLATSDHDIVDARSDQRDLLDWATGRFDAVGLELPSLTITVHDDRAACDGSAGLFYLTPPARISLCAIDEPTTAGARLIVLHELAHAWAETQADEATLDAFLTARGLSVWRDPQVPQWRWGQEQVAEVLSWGLMDQAVHVARIYDAGPADLAAAFEVLVDRPPLVIDDVALAAGSGD